MTRSYPPNGGSSEYSNIINGVGNVRRLLDEEFAKKLAEGDLLALVGLVTAGSSATLQALTTNNIVPFQRSNISQLVNSAASIADDVAASTGSIVRGGIGGLVAAGKTLFAIAGKIIAIVLAILMAVFFIETEIQRISGIINELLSLRDRVAVLEEELTGLRQVTEQGFQAVNNNVVAVNSNLENVQSNLARGIRITASSTNELIKAESFGVKTAVNSVKTELGDQVESFQADFAAADARNQEWQFNNRAAAVATLTVAGVTAVGGLLDKTYKNTEAINDGIGGIRNNVRQGFEDMKDKFKKIGSMIDIGRIIDMITLITVIHNAAMLSSNLLSTLFQVIDNGLNIALNAMNVKDGDGQQVDSEKAFMGTFDAVARRIFGVSTWEALKARWAATNRIVSTGSTLLWSVRDLMDNTQALAEIAAENSAKVGNALRRAGAIFDVGAWFPENYNHRTILHRRLTNLTQFLGNAQNLAQVFEEITSTTIGIQENIEEINKNNDEFQKALKEGQKKFREDNQPTKEEENEAKRKPNSVQNITPSDLERSGS